MILRCGLVLVCLAGSLLAQTQHYFPDVVLKNQHGQELRFYSDLLKGKTVVINSFFSTCTGVCPLMTQKIGAMAEAAGDRLGKDIYFLSISVDPATDTTQRLLSYSKRYGAKPGWHFLTGTKENVDAVLFKLGQYVEAKEDHTTVILVGNEPRRRWKKLLAASSPEHLIAHFKEVSEQ